MHFPSCGLTSQRLRHIWIFAWRKGNGGCTLKRGAAYGECLEKQKWTYSRRTWLCIACYGAPIWALENCEKKILTLKTVLFLALSFLKRVGDLQALSISPLYMEDSAPTVAWLCSYSRFESFSLPAGGLGCSLPHGGGVRISKSLSCEGAEDLCWLYSATTWVRPAVHLFWE